MIPSLSFERAGIVPLFISGPRFERWCATGFFGHLAMVATEQGVFLLPAIAGTVLLILLDRAKGLLPAPQVFQGMRGDRSARRA
jgi:hypothetical protein